MDIINLQDGRSFVVYETIKNSNPTDELVKNIKTNRRYETTIKHGNNVLLCNEILDANYEIILDSPIKSPEISNIKMNTNNIEDIYKSQDNIGNNIDVSI